MLEDKAIMKAESDLHDGKIMNIEPDIRSVNRFFLLVFLLIMVLGSILQVLHLEVGMLFTQWVIVLVPAILYWDKYTLKMPRRTPLKTKFLPTLLVLSLSALILNMTFALILVEGLMNLGFEPTTILPVPETLGQLGMYLFIIAFTAGVCEEVLFRGTIMPFLERYGQLPALVFSSLLFALMHLSFMNLIGSFFLGLLFGLVVLKSGSLLAGMLLHMLNNAFAIIFLYVAGDVEVGLQSLSSVFYLLPILALAGLIYGLRKLQHQSGAKPLLQSREGWLPKGWATGAFFVVLFIFMCLVVLQLFVGFGFFNGSF